MESPKRSFSFSFDGNRLTKRTYNLTDTTLSRSPVSQLQKPAFFDNRFAETKKRATGRRSFLQTFNSRFQTIPEPETYKASNPLRDSKAITSLSMQSMTQAHLKPKFTLLKLHKHNRERSNPQIQRWDTNIKKWQNINNRLVRLLPQPIVKPPTKIVIKQPIVITEQKVKDLTDELTKHLEHFWNIYINAEKMTGFLREMEGFNQIVANVLMKNGLFGPITNPQQIYKRFQIFKKQDQRTEDFTTADIKLYSALDYFCIKMQQKVKGCHQDFSQRLKKRINFQTHSLEDKIKVMEGRNIRQHTATMKFLASKRLYLSRYSKGDSLKKLEEMGVKFSIQQIMRDKIISSREKAHVGITDTLVQNSKTATYRISNPHKFFGMNAQKY